MIEVMREFFSNVSLYFRAFASIIVSLPLILRIVYIWGQLMRDKQYREAMKTMKEIAEHNKNLLPIFLILIMVTACSCTPLKYEADIGFLNSAQANSMEYLVKIGNKTCKDVDGIVGLCAKRIASNEDAVFNLEKRPYGYRLNVECSKAIDFKLSIDVLKETNFSFKIPSANYGEEKSFTCIGEVFPDDREQSVSASFSVRFIIFDAQYRSREEIYYDKKLLVLGKNAKYINVDGKEYEKAPAIKIKKFTTAYSESEMMRFNYAGY